MDPWDWRANVPPEIDAAWKTIGWWHRNKPKERMVLVLLHGHPCFVFTKPDPGWAPEHVRDARTALGLPRNPKETS